MGILVVGCDDNDDEGDDEDGGEDLRWADYAGSIVILLQGDPWHWQGLDLVITFAPYPLNMLMMTMMVMMVTMVLMIATVIKNLYGITRDSFDKQA